MKKSDVNGEHQLPLYAYLKSKKGFAGFGKVAKAAAMGIMLRKIDKNYKENPDIKWNFTKFLVDRQGTVSYTHLDVYKRQAWEFPPELANME